MAQMSTEISLSLGTGGRTPMPNDISAPSTPLSLSFTQFRLASTDSMQSLSSVSYYNSSPILRDFHDMSLALTDDEDLENNDNNNNSSKNNLTNSLFVFCDNNNKYNIITTPTPTPRSNQNNDEYDVDDNVDDNVDIKHICSFKNISSSNDRDTDNLSDDENDENPFLMGLEINIPSRKSSGYATFNEEDILPEIESCDDEEDEYSNNYFVDDIDCDEFSHFEESVTMEMTEDDNDNDNDNDNDEYIINNDRKFIMKKYKYIENIGIGAFGIVDKVYDRKKSKYVAIKQSRCIGDEILKQFQNEFKILKEFTDCKYIINLSDYGRNIDANQICLALEYMDIGSLKNIKSYSISEIKYISKCILLALKELHSKLYVHNDIKPDNILISSDGSVKLIDFGCTMQMKSENEPLTKSIGSIRYLSFEKRFMSPIQYNTKSDIYSFGITISEIFNGEHIYQKKTLYDHYFMKNPSTKLKNNTNKDFDDFISKCIESDPNKRWSAKQLLNHPFLTNDCPQIIQFTQN